jgi:hypothetical protein
MVYLLLQDEVPEQQLVFLTSTGKSPQFTLHESLYVMTVTSFKQSETGLTSSMNTIFGADCAAAHATHSVLLSAFAIVGPTVVMASIDAMIGFFRYFVMATSFSSILR